MRKIEKKPTQYRNENTLKQMAARNGTTDVSTTPLLGVPDTMYPRPCVRYLGMSARLVALWIRIQAQKINVSKKMPVLKKR
jgi:hypothetical protein